MALTISETKHNESPAGDVRITLRAKAILSPQQDALRACYRQQFADADTLLSLGGFHLNS